MNEFIRRRSFLKKGTQALATTALFPHLLRAAAPKKKARIGFIGVGLRGRNHVANTLLFPEVDITAICDIDPAAIAQTQQMLSKAGRKAAAAYGKNERDFENMLRRDDLDGVVIATAWVRHIPIAVTTMKAGN